MFSPLTRFPSLQDFRKYPTTVLLMLVCTSLGFVFNTFINTSDKRLQDVKEENIYLKAQLSRKDSLLQDLQNQLFITNGILQQVPPIIDSITKNKTQKQVNTLIGK